MAKGLAKSVSCDSCGTTLTNYHGAGIPGQVLCTSSIFGTSDKIVLCGRCSDHEENEIHRLGTNDIPKLRERYAKNASLFAYCNIQE